MLRRRLRSTFLKTSGMEYTLPGVRLQAHVQLPTIWFQLLTARHASESHRHLRALPQSGGLLLIGRWQDLGHVLHHLLLVLAELRFEVRAVQPGLTFGRAHRLEIAKFAAHSPLAIGWLLTKLSDGLANLFLLFGR